ncbi:hypothetical protein L6164_017402 [Bauhinia variegata]|uniref:Uncharacterized protein n=1 Tax=Bauhinia variegata TaxID=167791 RepID=A0ACB9N814_BAUVA|nr:hypothetical protein L6164_017402 [Bauhinia variegata]
MALSRVLIVLALTATIFSTIAMAKDFIVGDEKGWTIGFDYQAWAADKVFDVGDKLVFKYPTGKHNVFKVDGIGFKNCVAPAATQAMTSGEDTIELATPGRKWYICGVANHCQTGQKLVIDVLSQTLAPSLPPSHSPAPAPLPWSHFSKWVPRKLFRGFH